MSRIFTAIRITVTLLFFYILFRKFVQLGDVVNDFGKINLFYIFPALILVLFTHTLTTFRWKIVCRSYKDIGFKRAMLLYLEGIFYASVTPGRLGEFVRGLMYARELKLKKSEGISTVLLERIFDIIVPFLMVVGFLVFENWIFMLLLCIIFVTPLYLLTILIISTFKNKIPFVKKLVINRLPKQDILAAGFLSCARWFLHSLLFVLVLKSLGITGIPFSYLAMVVNLTALSLFLPITVNGWGLRETIFVVLLSGFMDRSTGLVASVLLALVSTYFLALIGTIPMLMRGKQKYHGNRA